MSVSIDANRDARHDPESESRRGPSPRRDSSVRQL